MRKYEPILTIKKIMVGAQRSPHTPSPRRLWYSCPICPTHFLVPSGAYA